MVGKSTHSRKVFIAFNYFFCVLIAAVCILPMIHIFAISLSSNYAVNAGTVKFLPVGFTLAAYRHILKDSSFFRSMGISFLRVILGVVIGMSICVLAAYPLSKTTRQFRARPFYVWYFMITIMISGGLIPTYLVIAKLGLLDHIMALVLPGAVNVFNIILLQNYMKGLPDEIMESAFVDGAGHWTTLTRIILPLCKPVLATLLLFVSVGHWNEWFSGLIYMNKPSHYPLQSYLQTLVVDIDPSLVTNADDALLNLTQKSNKSAQIFLAMLPVLMIYPFVQKYFTKGIVMGSVKG